MRHAIATTPLIFSSPFELLGLKSTSSTISTAVFSAENSRVIGAVSQNRRLLGSRLLSCLFQALDRPRRLAEEEAGRVMFQLAQRIIEGLSGEPDISQRIVQ